MKPHLDIGSVRFRASGIHHICTHLDQITENQAEKIAFLEGKEKLTALQEKELQTLIEKRDAKPVLPPGAISYLYDIYDAAVYGIREEIHNKYVDKGELCEMDSLRLAAKYLPWILVKNKTNFKKGHISGTPDALPTDDVVIDTKTSWNLRTFRSSEMTVPYFWQLQAYMYLTGAKRGILAYCLVDTPESIILDEVKRQTHYRGIMDEHSDEYVRIEEQCFRNMKFSDRIPAKNRVKFFTIQRDETLISKMIDRADMCIDKLMEIHESEIKYKPKYEVPA